jgi:hypothetical protein
MPQTLGAEGATYIDLASRSSGHCRHVNQILFYVLAGKDIHLISTMREFIKHSSWDLSQPESSD